MSNAHDNDIDLDLDLGGAPETDFDFDFNLEDPTLPNESTGEISFELQLEDAGNTTDYFTKISPLFEADPPTEDFSLPGEDLSPDEDSQVEDPNGMVMDAVEANLRYKQAELKFYSSENAMQATDQVNRLYNSLIKGGTNLDKAAISALLRSVLNYDNTSIFAKATKEDYELVIYEILRGIVLRLKESRSLDESIALAYITTFDEVKTRYRNLSKKANLDEMQELASVVGKLNQIITSQQNLKSIYFSIKSAIPAIQSLKKFIVSDGTSTSKQSREVAEHIADLTADVELLEMIGEKIDPEEIDPDAILNQPIGAIFKSIQSPSSDEHGNIGFTYVCGHCGSTHFTMRAPFRANHIPPSKYNERTGYSYDVIDYASAMLLVFNPIQCPDCRAINMFSKNFIMNSKLAVYHLAKSLLLSDGRKGYTVVNLIFLAEALQGLLSPDDTKLIPPDVVKTHDYEGSNPLDDPKTLEESLGSFIKMVESTAFLQKLQAEQTNRNVQYLKFLYQRIKPIVSLAVDEYSAAYAVLRSNMALLESLRQASEDKHRLEREEFLLRIAQNLVKLLGAPMYTESIVNSTLLTEVLSEYYTLIDVPMTLSLQDMKFDEIRTMLTPVISSLLEQNVTDKQANQQQIEMILDAYVRDYQPGRIGRVEQGIDTIDRTGVLAQIWEKFSPMYVDMLIETVTPIVAQYPTSAAFLGASLKFGQNGTLENSARDFEKLLKRNYKLNVSLPCSGSTAALVHDILDCVVHIEDSGVFSAITHVPLRLLTGDATPRIKTFDTLTNYVLYEFANVFGDAYSYEPFLDLQNMEDALKSRIREEQRDSDSPRSADVINADLYDAAYLFIHCVPTDVSEYQDEKHELEAYIRNEYEQETKRFKELGI